MAFSLNRNEFAANKLGNLNGENVLDIGCRDKIFKKYLKGNFNYTGLDYDPTYNGNEENYINLNLENGLKNLKKEYDIINALDVLEHLENIHDVFKELFSNSKKKICIALPNLGYYKFRMNYLFKAELSEKYIFHQKKVVDRHRWIPNYVGIEKFVRKNIDNNWTYKRYEFIAERKGFSIFYILEKILSKFLPSLFVYEIIFIFEKR